VRQRRRPTQKRSLETVDSILQAARRLLEREGPPAFTTNKIAAEAGVGVGTVYDYFADKDEVAMALVDRLSQEEIEAVAKEIEADFFDPLELVESSVAALVAVYWEHQPLLDALWAAAASVRKVGARPGEQRIVSLLEERLRELGLPDDRVDTAAFVCFHMVESLAMRFAQHRDRFDRRQAVEAVSTAVAKYLDLPTSKKAASKGGRARGHRPGGS
jgi:AcrR family transcriptional regulator